MGKLTVILSVVLAFTILHENGVTAPRSASEVPPWPFDKKCRVLFSEIRIMYPQHKQQFIEYHIYCNDNEASVIDVKHFRMAVLDKHLNIVGFCKLTGEFSRPVANRALFYYVIGGTNEDLGDKVNMKFDDENCRFSHLQETIPVLPDGKTEPYGLILLRNRRSQILDALDLELVENEVYQKKMSTKKLIKLMVENMQDFLVYGKFEEKTQFHKIYSAYTDVEHFLNDQESEITENSRSICRCIDNASPVSPHLFESCLPSLGEANHCTNTIPLVRTRIRHHGHHAENENPVPVGDGEPPSKRSRPETSGENDNEAEPIDIEPTKVVWEDCSRFNSVWLDDIIDEDKVEQSEIIKPSVCFWYFYNLESKKGKCKLCHDLVVEKKFISDRRGSRYMNDKFISNQGYMHQEGADRFRKNKEKINFHLENKLHKMAVQYFSLKDKGFDGKNLEEIMENDKDGEYFKYYEATKNLMILVKKAMHLNLSFYKFKSFVETFKYFNIPIGNLHQNRLGVAKIMTHISNSMHKKYIEFLKEKKPLISVIIDETTDVSVHSVMSVVFKHKSINEKEESFLYKIIELQDGMTAKEIYDLIIIEFQRDGIEELMKEKMNGFISDGAPTVALAVRALFEEFADLELISTWCVSHRIELIFKWAFKDVEYVIDMIQRYAKFRAFMHRSAKRKNTLRLVQRQRNLRKFEIHGVEGTRWSSYKARAFTSFVKFHAAYAATFNLIKNDKTMSDKTREEAREIESFVVDPGFIVHSAFLADLFNIFKKWSETTQFKTATLIQKKRVLVGMRDQIKKLKTNHGPLLKGILEKSQSETLEEFETADEISLEGTALRRMVGEEGIETYLYENINSYINNVLTQFDKYFPTDVDDEFDLLHPLSLPVEFLPGVPLSAGFTALNDQYKFTENSLDFTNDVEKLFISIQNSGKLQEAKTRWAKNPIDFWNFFLTNTDIEWTEITRTFVQRALSSALSSAQCERIFSILKSIHTNRRYSLEPKSVDGILRIMINSENDLTKFDEFETAKSFVHTYSRPDDETRRTTWYKKGKERVVDGDIVVEDDSDAEETEEESVFEYDPYEDDLNTCEDNDDDDDDACTANENSAEVE